MFGLNPRTIYQRPPLSKQKPQESQQPSLSLPATPHNQPSSASDAKAQSNFARQLDLYNNTRFSKLFIQ